MTLFQRIIFVTLKWLLMLVFVGGLMLTVINEGFRIVRAGYNTDGTIVHGYALHEKILPVPQSVENWPVIGPRRTGWEHLDFYQHSFECEFWRSRKQSNWEDERERKLKTRPEEKPVWREDELPLVRYQCGPSRMLYGAGQGWGLF